MVKRGSKLGVHGAREDYSVNTGIFDAFRNFEKKTPVSKAFLIDFRFRLS